MAVGAKPPWRSRPSSGDSPGTRETLILVAGQLMTEKGSPEFSLGELSQRTGLSAALVQYHFGSKRGLLMALVERGTQKAVAQLKALEKMEASASVKLKIHVHGLVAAYANAPYINSLLHLMIGNTSEEGARYISRIFIEPVAAFYRSLIAQGVAEGSFRAIDPMHFYFILVGACEHIVVRRQAWRHVFGVSLEGEALRSTYADTVYQVVLNGVRK